VAGWLLWLLAAVAAVAVGCSGLLVVVACWLLLLWMWLLLLGSDAVDGAVVAGSRCRCCDCCCMMLVGFTAAAAAAVAGIADIGLMELRAGWVVGGDGSLVVWFGRVFQFNQWLNGKKN
jgi:hypothetical protein